jgi:hypothetical protein
MGASCFIALRLGDRPERRTAMLVAICWSLTTVAEVATGRQAEPVIIGDAVAGVGLLWLAWRYNKGFLWVMIALEATLFFLHALLDEAGLPPNRMQTTGNNLLATGALAALVIGALGSWRKRVKARTELAR